MAAHLGSAEIYKHGTWRARLFASKLREGSSFHLRDGSEVIFQKDDRIITRLEGCIPVRSLRLQTKCGRSVRFTEVAKTPEFGGKMGSGWSPIKIESIAMTDLSEKIESTLEQLELPFIFIDSHRVVGVEPTPGNPKSDFHLIDEDGNPCYWISHKAGTSPLDFQQWGGISEAAEKRTFDHPETQQFIMDLGAEYGEELPPKTARIRTIDDLNLKMKAVYGSDYGSDERGVNNVDLVVQGELNLFQIPNTQMEFDIMGDITHQNGDIVSGDYEPAFFAAYRSSRNSCGIRNARLTISPRGGRKNAKSINRFGGSIKQQRE